MRTYTRAHLHAHTLVLCRNLEGATSNEKALSGIVLGGMNLAIVLLPLQLIFKMLSGPITHLAECWCGPCLRWYSRLRGNGEQTAVVEDEDVAEIDVFDRDADAAAGRDAEGKGDDNGQGVGADEAREGPVYTGSAEHDGDSAVVCL